MLRVNNQTDGWDGSCTSSAGDFCSNEAGTLRSFTGTPGAIYSTWVHACNAGGCSSAVNNSFSCGFPAPTANLLINGADGTSSGSPVNVAYTAGGTVPFTWTTSNADTCSGGGPNFGGSKSTAIGVQTENVAIPASAGLNTYTLTCNKGAVSVTDTEYMNVTCAEVSRAWSRCSNSCGAGTKHLTVTTTCGSTSGPDVACSVAPCGGVNWVEVAP